MVESQDKGLSLQQKQYIPGIIVIDSHKTIVETSHNELKIVRKGYNKFHDITTNLNSKPNKNACSLSVILSLSIIWKEK